MMLAIEPAESTDASIVAGMHVTLGSRNQLRHLRWVPLWVRTEEEEFEFSDLGSLPVLFAGT